MHLIFMQINIECKGQWWRWEQRGSGGRGDVIINDASKNDILCEGKVELQKQLMQ